MARRPALALTALAAIPFGLTALTGADWIRRSGLDVWNVPAARADLDRADARGRDLDETREEVVRRSAAASRVIDRLVEAQHTLAAAAAELELLHRDWPDYMAGLRTYFRGPTDRERFARSAIERAKVRLAADPGRTAEVIGRLESELAALSASP